MPDVEIITTEDGSHSLYVPDIDEAYHSRFGALTESVHVYIQNGLYERLEINNPESISVFEVGFGTGLNALLTVLACLKRGIKLQYTAIEPFPVEKNILKKLNYVSMLSHPDASEWFTWLHSTDWSKLNSKGNITFTKHNVKLEEFHPEEKFDVIYFDAFAPEKQPDLWRKEIYEKMFSMINELGIMTTYCAKGQVKRELLARGFMVEKVDGPPGKREMIRASKPPQNS